MINIIAIKVVPRTIVLDCDGVFVCSFGITVSIFRIGALGLTKKEPVTVYGIVVIQSIAAAKEIN
ncbi:hypothetical protein [Enterococcus sp. BWR-S5]|uniref:hypothetical protein n=1 Tax=Enterococcus sp. BWR-S5 TaxID=2787714 RepID=UPI00192086B3|nr:hypothetical protein [Enterococcus sp. BWR-S5]MBL1225632.1 hypothetical protein [Enterococcus sp. BWR-S5]